ncbi:class I SAM-dependent methyltransferase [candidate division CSSED10-310 bacterium]|uniref:Class I SAM-dependent methyltransferase n=1 Tax=candidate division CSSED10-310 bacterium TaxID=2855610 RepID=A0ABV6YUR1_UNCC1
MAAENYICETVAYYNKYAQDYCDNTIHLNMSVFYEAFLGLVPPGGKILDAGCGSGRDTLYFKKCGYVVVAFDYASEIVKYASKIIAQPVLKMSFQELNFSNEFDGIWACASLLHVAKRDITSVMNKLIRALKKNGALYLSVKQGHKEVIRTGRFFNCYTATDLKTLMSQFPEITIIEQWQTVDVREGREKDFWQNMLVQKI